jgi:arylsulfatase A-like enzyme/tetratricopeptide (TPR) repeat protein
MRRHAGILLGVVVAAAAVFVWWQAWRPEPAVPLRPNVVLITIDTLRADRVGAGLTPAIDALLARGITFTHARATAPLTLPSHVSIMTGVLPPEHGVRENGVHRVTGDRPTLASVLWDAGYQTVAFVSAYVLDRRFGLNHGFDDYDDRVARDSASTDRLEAERAGAETITAALEWVTGLPSGATEGAPYFLWVHLYDPHAPYAPPASFLADHPDDRYGAEIAYTDAQVDRLLRVIDPDVQAGRTIVAVTGDHGESLGDHGESTHGMLVYDSAIRVPLGIVAAGQIAGGVHNEPVSLAALAPTLLSLAGRTVPPEMTSPALWPPTSISSAAPAYAETNYPRVAGWSPLRSLADDRWKLIQSSETELYDLAGDPLEQHDVSDAHPGVVRAMSAALEALTKAAPSTPVAISAEATARLRALGYVAVAPDAPAGPGDAPNPGRHVAEWSAFEVVLSDLAAGRTAGVVERLARWVTQYPDAPVFASTHARALVEAGRGAEALRAYRAAAKRWPTDSVLLHDLAVAARAAGALDEALAAEQAAMALDGANAPAANGLGLLYVDQGRWGEALAAFANATRLDATNASYWTNLGNVRREQGDAAGARTAYERAWSLDPGSPDAANGLGVLLVQSARPGEAVVWFDRALRADPQFWEGRLNLGIAYEQSGQVEQAIAAFRAVLGAPPEYPRERQAAQIMLGRLGKR